MADDLNTNPTVETILERIDALGEQLSARLDTFDRNINSRFDRVESRLDLLGGSVQRLGSQIKVLHQGMLEVKTDADLLSRRVDDLES